MIQIIPISLGYLAPPTTQSEYTYQPLPKDNVPLLRQLPAGELAHEEDTVECELLSISLSKRLYYQALSYVWGPANDKRNIRLNRCLFPVRANLEAAFKRIRTGVQDTYLWADAIRINQEDEL